MSGGHGGGSQLFERTCRACVMRDSGAGMVCLDCIRKGSCILPVPRRQARPGQGLAEEESTLPHALAPGSSSWLNLVEGFFRDLSQSVTQGSFSSAEELAQTILAFLPSATLTRSDTSGGQKARTSCARFSAPARR